MAKQRARGGRLIGLLAVLALIAAACGGGGNGDDGGGDGAAGGEGGGDGEVSGSATILSAFTEEDDTEGVNAMINLFNEQFPDADITHEGSPSFEEQALTRVEGGSPPDMMFIPQPGLMKDFFDRDAALSLDDMVDVGTIEEEFVPGTLQAGRVNGQLVGVPTRLTVKSLVWYPKPAWDEAGYEVPETWADMVALTDQIRGDMGEQGRAPWCIGIESGQATGWPFTDWVEDVMLRLHGPDVYDEWLGHAVEFDSPEVSAAFEQVADIWFEEGNVLGGRANIVQTSFQAAPSPMFEDPPACMLHRQASFAQQLFPEDTEYGTDYDFFFLPPIEDGGTGENPMLTAGDLLVAFNDTPIVRAFVEFAATVEAQEAWAENGNMLCSNAQCSSDIYPNEAFVKQGELLANASSARFDGSDMMPAAVGTGSFWSEGTAFVAGEQELQATLQGIDAAWPEGACGVGGVGPNCEGGGAEESSS